MLFQGYQWTVNIGNTSKAQKKSQEEKEDAIQKQAMVLLSALNSVSYMILGRQSTHRQFKHFILLPFFTPGVQHSVK